MVSKPVLEREYPSRADSVGQSRHEVVAELERQGIDHDLSERAALALSELVANAVEAGPDDVSVTLVADGPGEPVRLTVTNATRTTTVPPRSTWGPTDPLAGRGRGLSIVATVCDTVRVVRRDRSVTMEVELYRSEPCEGGTDSRR